eukprot:scaffold6150_cov186-Skeletonema_dohrnii-CCMP3373.AAC.1
MNLSATWSIHYSNLLGSDQGNLNMTEYSIASSGETAGDTRINRLGESEDYVFAIADSDRGIHLLHSPKILGGTLLRPGQKLMSLVGLGSTSIPVILQIDGMKKFYQFKTAKLDEMKGCSSAEEIKTLSSGTGRTVPNFVAGAFFLPAPWLMTKLIENLEDSAGQGGDPHELIYVALKGASDYETAHADDDDYETGQATAHAEAFACWAWGVAIGKVKETRYQLQPADADIALHLEQRQRSCIMPSAPTGGATGTGIGHNNPDSVSVIAQLSENMAQSTEQAAMANQLQREVIDKAERAAAEKADKMKTDLHPATLNMICYAASTDGESKGSPPKTCVAFYKCKSEGYADQNVKDTLETKGCKDAAYAHGLIQALRVGTFLWTNSDRPNNFSIFCIFPTHTGSNQNSERQILLHLLASHSTSIAETTTRKLAEQSVYAPTDYYGAVDHIRYFAELTEIFFGAGTQCVDALRSLLQILL